MTPSHILSPFLSRLIPLFPSSPIYNLPGDASFHLLLRLGCCVHLDARKRVKSRNLAQQLQRENPWDPYACLYLGRCATETARAEREKWTSTSRMSTDDKIDDAGMLLEHNTRGTGEADQEEDEEVWNEINEEMALDEALEALERCLKVLNAVDMITQVDYDAVSAREGLKRKQSTSDELSDEIIDHAIMLKNNDIFSDISTNDKIRNELKVVFGYDF